ncbi:HD-GYP domain-containing protein [Fusibacter tunisiensis]|uniref:HD-GYP domain-containing protein (C-di-GMP phosphodiesterase class II) n=1 Tax=Fusibacter tunisiensis TaxID=1008308 RepID=A0ABS2MP55_9FIRM|nr:HD-GYP domain-containing protein [Fusibacter tunisiensis]MBM7561190.1 HD-GYP domain-containing protein (c-di-GMP phosphodiesterase class II) [Fusibacter tunisiensis]
MRFTPLDYLKENSLLAQNLTNIKNQILLRKNAKLSSKNVERIRALGFKSLYTKTPEEEALLEEDVKDIIDPIVRKKAIHDIKKCIQSFEDQISKQKKELIYGKAGQELVEIMGTVSSTLVDEILNSADLKISIMDLKSESDYDYEHAVNTAVLSIMTAVKKGMNVIDIQNIAKAALLANIGYKDISSDVYHHDGPLTDSQRYTIQKHPEYSHALLSKNTNLNAHVRTAILQHHERMDGSGYPNNLTSDDIHDYAKIIMIADVYDAMTSDRIHRSAFLHNEVLEYIMGNAGSLFDFDYANIFIRCIVPYPAGTYVQLSDHSKAIVLKNNPSHPLRPVIRRFNGTTVDMTEKGLIDLLEKRNLTIEKIIYD